MAIRAPQAASKVASSTDGQIGGIEIHQEPHAFHEQVQPTQPALMSLVALGALICAAFVFAACIAGQVILRSNIWPIAAALRAVPTVPVGAGIGALTGLVVRKTGRTTALTVIIVTGIVMAALAVTIIVRNP